MVERSELGENGAERSEAVVREAQTPGSNPLGALANKGLDPGRASGASAKKQDPEVLAKATRRRFTAGYKRQILKQAAKCSEHGEIGELLRREGLYASQLSMWRRAADQALEPVQRGPKAKPVDPNAAELKALRKENAMLQKRLKKAELILDIQKKVALLLGIPLNRPDLNEDD